LFFVAYNLYVVICSVMSVFEFLYKFFLGISIRDVLDHNIGSHILPFFDHLKMTLVYGDCVTAIGNHRGDSGACL
jgi:hypothetical protein